MNTFWLRKDVHMGTFLGICAVGFAATLVLWLEALFGSLVGPVIFVGFIMWLVVAVVRRRREMARERAYKRYYERMRNDAA